MEEDAYVLEPPRLSLAVPYVPVSPARYSLSRRPSLDVLAPSRTFSQSPQLIMIQLDRLAPRRLTLSSPTSRDLILVLFRSFLLALLLALATTPYQFALLVLYQSAVQ